MPWLLRYWAGSRMGVLAIESFVERGKHISEGISVKTLEVGTLEPFNCRVHLSKHGGLSMQPMHRATYNRPSQCHTYLAQSFKCCRRLTSLRVYPRSACSRCFQSRCTRWITCADETPHIYIPDAHLGVQDSAFGKCSIPSVLGLAPMWTLRLALR